MWWQCETTCTTNFNMQRGYQFLWISLCCVILGACSQFSQLQTHSDWHVQHKGALDYYEQKDYYKAATLFEIVLPKLVGTKAAIDALFKLAMSNFWSEKTVCVQQFDDFCNDYPSSYYIEEASYYAGIASANIAPNIDNDQTPTEAAVMKLKHYIQTYPQGQHIQQAKETLNRLQEKLLQKQFNIAKFYYKMQQYPAAVVKLLQFQKECTLGRLAEQTAYLLTKTHYWYAKKSHPAEQKERFETALAYAQTFLCQYPDSRYHDKILNFKEKIEHLLITPLSTP